MRAMPTGLSAWRSSISFTKTVKYYRRQLKHRRVEHEFIPPYRYRGVLVCRFIATTADVGWQAIQVYKIGKITYIYVVPHRPKSSP